MRFFQFLFFLMLLILQGCHPNKENTLPGISIKEKSLFSNDKPIALEALVFDAYKIETIENLDTKLKFKKYDYKKVKDLGFNTIRLNVDGNWYVENSKLFLGWLEKNIEWARSSGLYILLDVSIPIFEERENEINIVNVEKNNELWSFLAKELKNEKQIAGFYVSKYFEENNNALAHLLEKIKIIRKNDGDRLVFLSISNQDYKNNFISSLENQKNIILDINFLSKTIKKGQQEKPGMPNANEIIFKPELGLFSDVLSENDNEWREFKSKKIFVDNKEIAGFKPLIGVYGAFHGKVYFDQIEVREYDEQGKLIGSVWNDNITAESVKNWWGWSQFSEKSSFKDSREQTDGWQDGHSLSLTINNDDNKGFGGWSGENLWIPVSAGHSYEIRGYMKGEGVKFVNKDNPPQIGFKLDAYVFRKKSVAPLISFLDSTLIINEYIEKVSSINHPISFMTFNIKSVESNELKIEVLSALSENNISYTFSSYIGGNSLFDSENKNLDTELLSIFNSIGKKTWDKLSFPPAGLKAKEVPQFVLLSFDDNILSSGMEWVLDVFSKRKNPNGNDNLQTLTFDGVPIKTSFYMNTSPFKDFKDDNAVGLIEMIGRASSEGHEIGNHTNNHHNDIVSDPWDKFINTIINLDKEAWVKKIDQCQKDLIDFIDLPSEKIVGYRAPFLAYNQEMYEVLESSNFKYDASIEDGHSQKFDGTNMRWPYRMNIDPPGHSESWAANPDNPNSVELNAVGDLWQIPQNILMIPEDSLAIDYGIKKGLWERMIKNAPYLQDRKITAFDFNLWVLAKLTKEEFLGILKYNLDLRLRGNRAPLSFGAHSQYYVDPRWPKENQVKASLEEMRLAIEEFLDYAISKPEVRVVSGIELISWMEKPTPLLN